MKHNSIIWNRMQIRSCRKFRLNWNVYVAQNWGQCVPLHGPGEDKSNPFGTSLPSSHRQSCPDVHHAPQGCLAIRGRKHFTRSPHLSCQHARASFSDATRPGGLFITYPSESTGSFTLLSNQIDVFFVLPAPHTPPSKNTWALNVHKAADPTLVSLVVLRNI